MLHLLLLLLRHSCWSANGLHSGCDNIGDITTILFLRVSHQCQGAVAGGQNVLLTVFGNHDGEATDFHAPEQF